jgi:hypothetical protein
MLHESVAFSHALLAATDKLKVIAAILPGPWNPTIAAKQILGPDPPQGPDEFLRAAVALVVVEPRLADRPELATP